MPDRRHANIWTNDDPFNWRVYGTLSLSQTEWPPFCRHHFETHFRQRKSLYFIICLTEICPHVKATINKNAAYFQIIDWYRTVDRCLSEQMMFYGHMYASLGLDEFQPQSGLKPIFAPKSADCFQCGIWWFKYIAKITTAWTKNRHSPETFVLKRTALHYIKTLR